MREGVWLGHADRTNEVLVGTESGVIRVYDVIRKPAKERWNAAKIQSIQGTPRQPDPNKPGGRIPVRVRFGEEEPVDSEDGEAKTKEVEFRRFRITPELLEKHGYTDNCEGCRHKKAKMKSTRPHTEECRNRIREEMMKNEEDKKALEKEEERIAHKMAQRIEEEKEKEEEEAKDVGAMALRAIREVSAREPSQVDIAEIYSPKRVTEAAALIGLRAGLAMDLTNGWDFTRQSHREAAKEYIRRVKPWLLIGSPECKMFSTLQNLSGPSPEKTEARKEAEGHMRFVCELYKLQVEGGRKFLHEHPAGASSWMLECVEAVRKLEGVIVTMADQCMYGLKTWSTNRRVADTPAQKRTRFMTNSRAIAERLSKQCDKKHKHQVLLDGRAKQAAVYPRGLCEAISLGLKEDLQERTFQLRTLITVKAGDKVNQTQVNTLRGGA